MGLLGKAVTKAVIKKAGKTAMYGIVSHEENTRSVDALVNNSTANHTLIIQKKSMSFKRGFTVYDEFEEKKYVIKTDAISIGYPCIRLYDTRENPIGKVELEAKIGKYICTIYLDGRKLGTLTRKTSIKAIKAKLDFSFNGWHIEGNFMQNSYAVYDKNGNSIMRFNDAFSSRDTYVLEMNDRQDEVLGLLLVMAVEITLHSDD